MGKKNDAKEICRKYNVVRDENRGKIFTLSELSILLKGILPGLPTYSTTAQEFGLFEATNQDTNFQTTQFTLEEWRTISKNTDKKLMS